MSLFAKGLLALAFVAALAAPVSAATWRVDFFDQSGTGIGTGTFTAAVPTLDPVFASDWVATVYGHTFLAVASRGLPRIEVLAGEIVVSFRVFKDGDPSLDTDILGFPSTSPGAPVLQEFSFFASGVPLDQGTYTLTRLPDVDPGTSVVPLPATAALLPLGLGALAMLRRRRGGRAA